MTQSMNQILIPIKFQANKENAKIQQDHSSKFTCGFVIHPGFIQGALWEIERYFKFGKI